MVSSKYEHDNFRKFTRQQKRRQVSCSRENPGRQKIPPLDSGKPDYIASLEPAKQAIAEKSALLYLRWH